MLTLAELGLAPEEVKQGIIEVLTPYFEHKEVLQDSATGILAPEAVNVMKFSNDPVAYRAFENVLNMYRTAASTDEEACWKCCAESENDILRGISEFWSLFFLEADKGDLPTDECRYETFRNIGAILEASLQPLLKSLLLQVRITRGKGGPHSDVRSLTLGTVVGELHDIRTFTEFLAPPPWGVRLNQWRNMAQHHRSWVNDGMIVGSYGKEPNEKEIVLSKVELAAAFQQISFILAAVRSAHTIFVIDNADKVQPYLTLASPRVDIKVFSLATALATQGYELKDLKVEDNFVTATIRDASPDSTQQRMAHATQFVYPIWCYFPEDLVEARYEDRTGTLKLIITAIGTDCKAIFDEEIPFESLARKVKLELLRD